MKTHATTFWLILCCFTASSHEASASQTNEQLTVDRIFGSGEFHTQGHGQMIWSHRGSSYFTWRASKDRRRGRDLVRVDINGDSEEIVASAGDFVPKNEGKPIGIQGIKFSSDESKLLIYTNSRRVWRQNTRGDYWLLDLKSKQLIKLGGDSEPATMMFAKFSPDGNQVAYVRQRNLFVQNLDDLKIVPLTTDTSPFLINGTSDWVNEEELGIRDGFRWSPDSKSIAFWQFDTSGVELFHLIDNAQGKYPRITSFAYPKVGQRNSATKLGVIQISSREICWLEIPGDPREHYLPQMEWFPDKNQLLIQQLNRLQNTNRVLRADPVTGKTQEIFKETDPAWLENDNPFRWVDGGKKLVWLSERDGWQHVYLAGTDGKSFSQITSGKFDVIRIDAIDKLAGNIYFTASPDDATQSYLYRVPLGGGDSIRMTPAKQSGWNSYNISADAQWAVHTYSTFAIPPTVAQIRLSDHSVIKVLSTNSKLRSKLESLRQPSSEFLKLDIGNGISLDAWCLKPPEFDPAKKYPLLIYVYGEPYGQTVRDSWPGNRGLWHWMFAQQGYLVVSIDNRGTRVPKGRAWRKSVYRKIGIIAPQEQAAATRVLLKQWPFADPNRIGIWGWSGGGSMSLNAIFRYPDLYHTAMAVAPVPNQLLYDTIYQERYMGLPSDNADGYRTGSPITYAKQLKGNLLIVHGTGDDNCHYQGTELLVNELIAQNKQFTIMPYPSRTHSVSEGRNTTRHLYSMLTRYLNQHVPPGGVPTNQDKPDCGSAEKSISWMTRTIEGWTVNINPMLLKQSKPALDRAMQLLTLQLKEIVRVVPKQAVQDLRKVPLWFSPVYPNTRARAEYHPNINWLRMNGRDPAMAKGVEFSNVSIFEQETRRMPNFALHELSHAYHDQILGFGHKQILSIFEQAKADGKYERVLRQNAQGQKRIDRAYAITNHKEYFAESTEAFFSRNDFFPFDRAQLRKHDPQMHNLLKGIWGND